MLLNRFVLREYIDDEYTITRIIKKATTYQITHDRMLNNRRGHLMPTPCFKSEDWIEAQIEFIATLRKDWIKYNQDLLDLVVRIGDIK